MISAVITLLTDFGQQDTYVGQMKGVIAGINPAARIVDLTHAIPPQQVGQGAMALAGACDAFPAGTIHVAVVDPGVGTTRRAIAAEIGPYRFVCPDNGLLTLVHRRHSIGRVAELNVARWWRPPVSSTFHGRDVFAPVAAAWSLGHDLAVLGTLTEIPLVELPFSSPRAVEGLREGSLSGEVISVDHFGNLITNISRESAPNLETGVSVVIAGRTIPGIEQCYGARPATDLVALFGSNDWLEVAVVNGNAARTLNVHVGEPVSLNWIRE